jgi:hypothetical protein
VASPWTFAVSLAAAEQQFAGFIDMCRYDQCTVLEVKASVLVLQRVGGPPTANRWASFGIHVLASTLMPYSTQYLIDEARSKLPFSPAPHPTPKLPPLN